ncbi:tRNA:m(4)X modification enzyme TRM13 [Portunus trituberculatus]|uniref:tRNA:m(4)X modification enzyme TRM13 n=1 Tax=Portunus trituberculatus TaxID=210409 RepID=A0A5B7JT05_PORTR|nr:tRNA:m(4)X modification enzyme TRM13 [Portunus trituberculatus]
MPSCYACFECVDFLNFLFSQSINVKRFRVDIQHLSLEGVEGSEDYQHIVGLGKHLCGSASDLALRCLCQHPGMQVVGVVLALCCHHRCVWDSYCGLEVLQPSISGAVTIVGSF